MGYKVTIHGTLKDFTVTINMGITLLILNLSEEIKEVS